MKREIEDNDELMKLARDLKLRDSRIFYLNKEKYQIRKLGEKEHDKKTV